MKKFCFTLLLAVSLSACSPFSPQLREEAAGDLPVAFSSYSLYEAAPQAPERWWESFEDPDLNRLLDEAFAGSFTLREAWARLKQADAAAVKAGSDLLPDLSISSDASAAKGEGESTFNNYSLGLTGSYELDLWGRVRSEREAKTLEANVSREDLNAAAITLSAEVVERYVGILTEKRQRALLESQLETSRTYLELTELRFRKSMASALDVYQQREAVAKLEAAIPPVEKEEQLLRHELALLLGKPPKADLEIGGESLPDIGELPATGLPADLLAQRPDVRSAGLRLQAADWEVAAARADRLPALRLTAGGGYGSSSLDALFDNWLLNLAGSLTGPVFDGGFRKAEVERTKAVAEERLAGYQAAVMTAVKEVEDALVKEEKQRQRIEALEVEISLARKALEEARGRYLKGLSDYLPVLTELQSVQNLERDLLRERSDLLSARISLHRALGGGWTDDLHPDMALSDSRKGLDDEQK